MADDPKDKDKPTTFSQDEVDALVTERLASAKAEGDTAFKNLWDEAKAAKEKLRAFDGIDPVEHKKMKDSIQALEQSSKAKKAGITAEELDKMRAEIRTDLEGEYAAVTTRAETLSAENRTLKLDNVVKAEMAKAGVRAERLDALYKLTAEDYDLTEDGVPIVTARPGKEVSKYVAEDLGKEYPEFFKGSGSSGGGSSKSSGGAPGTVTTIASTDISKHADGLLDGSVVIEGWPASP